MIEKPEIFEEDDDSNGPPPIPPLGSFSNETSIVDGGASVGAIIAFLKKYGPLLKFVAEILKSGGNDRKWLEAALGQIGEQLELIVGMIADLTYEIEVLRSEIQKTPVRTLHLIVEVRISGILSRFQTITAGDEPIQGDRLELLRTLHSDAFTTTHEILSSPREFALLAPVIGMLAPTTISASRIIPDSSAQVREQTLAKLESFISFTLDEGQVGSLAWIEKNRRLALDARNREIAHHSRSIVKRHWFYDNGDKIHHSARISFSGTPGGNYSYQIVEIENRVVERYVPPPPPPPEGGFTHDEVYFVAGDREIPGRQRTNSRGRANRRYRDLGEQEVGILNDLSRRWREENNEFDLAFNALKAAQNLPDVLASLRASE